MSARWSSLTALRVRTFLFDCHLRPERSREFVRTPWGSEQAIRVLRSNADGRCGPWPGRGSALVRNAGVPAAGSSDIGSGMLLDQPVHRQCDQYPEAAQAARTANSPTLKSAAWRPTRMTLADSARPTGMVIRDMSVIVAPDGHQGGWSRLGRRTGAHRSTTSSRPRSTCVRTAAFEEFFQVLGVQRHLFFACLSTKSGSSSFPIPCPFNSRVRVTRDRVP